MGLQVLFLELQLGCLALPCGLKLVSWEPQVFQNLQEMHGEGCVAESQVPLLGFSE